MPVVVPLKPKRVLLITDGNPKALDPFRPYLPDRAEIVTVETVDEARATLAENDDFGQFCLRGENGFVGLWFRPEGLAKLRERTN
jgi:hypothetical protein